MVIERASDNLKSSGPRARDWFSLWSLLPGSHRHARARTWMANLVPGHGQGTAMKDVEAYRGLCASCRPRSDRTAWECRDEYHTSGCCADPGAVASRTRDLPAKKWRVVGLTRLVKAPDGAGKPDMGGFWLLRHLRKRSDRRIWGRVLPHHLRFFGSLRMT
jgi:hypothetical protein